MHTALGYVPGEEFCVAMAFLGKNCLSLGNTTGASAYIIPTGGVEELNSSPSAQML